MQLALGPIWLAATWFALAVIIVIGLQLLLQKVRRREEPRADRGDRGLPPGVDPATLRRNRPRTNRLSGAVLIVAALFLIVVFGPFLGLSR